MKLPEKLITVLEDWESNDAHGDIRIFYENGKPVRYLVNQSFKSEDAYVEFELIEEEGK